MKRIYDTAMTQVERTKRYHEKNNLVLFSVRIEKSLADRVSRRLQVDHQSKPAFVKEAIKRYLEERWFEQNRP